MTEIALANYSYMRYYRKDMAQQKNMGIVSFRLPIEAMKKLKKQVEYTKWVQHLVLANLGLCPLCSEHKEEKKDANANKVV